MKLDFRRFTSRLLVISYFYHSFISKHKSKTQKASESKNYFFKRKKDLGAFPKLVTNIKFFSVDRTTKAILCGVFLL